MESGTMIRSRWSLILLALCVTTVGVACAGAPPTPHVLTPPTPRPVLLNGAALGWEEAIGIALAQHPLLRMAEHDVLASEAVTKQIESANYPQITGFYANSGGNARTLLNFNTSGSLPKPTNYLTTPGVRVDLLITDFGHTAHTVLMNKSLAAAAENNVSTAKALVILNVEQAYLNCLKQQRLVEIAREVLKERELIRQQVESLYRHQLRSKLDLDFASVEATRAEVALIKAQNDLKAAFAALNNAMGIQAPNEYVLEKVAIDVKPPEPIVTLFETALSQRPELLSSKDRIQAAEEAIQAARALKFGNITGIGVAGYTWWGRQELINGINVSNPGAQLGWWGAGGTSAFPLYTGGRLEGQVEEAEARKGEVQASTRSLVNDVVLQVAQAYLTRLTAEEQIKVAEERVAHAREALTLARERYKASLSSILEVTTATANLLTAEVGLAVAQYDYRTSEAAVAYATGAEYPRY